jgi:uncharacterized protein YbjT (DUF2867 family)
MLPIKSAIAVLVLLSMAACSTLEQIESSPMASQLITNQITLRFIAGGSDPVARAAALRETLADLRIEVSGPELYSLADIEGVVRDRINWADYSMADQELLNYGLTTARVAIQDLVGEGVIQLDQRESLETLLRWIDQAAQRVR